MVLVVALRVRWEVKEEKSRFIALFDSSTEHCCVLYSFRAGWLMSCQSVWVGLDLEGPLGSFSVPLMYII